MGVGARTALTRGPWNTVSVCLAVCTVVYILTNLILMKRSSELAGRSRTSVGVIDPALEGGQAVEEEEGWWLPNSPGIHVESDLHLRHLLGEGFPSTVNATPLHRLTPLQVRRSLEKSSSCDRVNRIENLTYLTSGWTKAVYRGRLDGRDVAVKRVDAVGYDVRRCVREGDGAMTPSQCQRKAEEKLLKEAFILRTLDNPHIVRLRDVCIPSTTSVGNEVNSGPSLVTELGEMADIIRLLQMSWEDRLRLVYGLSKLVAYLAHSPYGSVGVNDFRRQQFVIVDGELKLIDVDDVGFDELICSQSGEGASDECQAQLPNDNATIQVRCVSGRCNGLNEIKNILSAGRHFVSVLLPHGAPTQLRHLVSQIVDAFSAATLRTRELLQLTEKLVQMYSRGLYLNRDREPARTAYTMMDESDLPGQFDYRCRYSIATSGCTVSVFDTREAEDLCEFDSDCQGFVISSETSWTGRLFAHLKNNISTPTHRIGTKLFIRPRS